MKNTLSEINCRLHIAEGKSEFEYKTTETERKKAEENE